MLGEDVDVGLDCRAGLACGMDERDPYAGATGRFYSFYIGRPRLARIVGKALWGSDFRPLYRELAGLRTLGDGSVVLDVACGAGLALRWLDPARAVRYIGVDSSPAMLVRAASEAQRRGYRDVVLHRADAADMPLAAATADIGLVFNALHCVPQPQAVLAEMVRCLKPGAPVVGSMLVRDAVTRADRLLDADASGLTGPGGTDVSLRGWLEDQLVDVQLHTTDALACFRARVPAVAQRPP